MDSRLHLPRTTSRLIAKGDSPHFGEEEKRAPPKRQSLEFAYNLHNLKAIAKERRAAKIKGNTVSLSFLAGSLCSCAVYKEARHFRIRSEMAIHFREFDVLNAGLLITRNFDSGAPG